MTRAICSTRILLAVIAATIALPSVALDCGRHIASSGPKARTIVLAGGDAWALFRQFLAEIEQRDLDVSLWKSKVQLSDKGRVRTIELGWTKPFSGESAERLWQERLRGKRAEINPQLLAAANGSQWDVICVGRLPQPDSRKNSAAAEAVVFFKSGVQYASRGDYANALKEFQAAEKISPAFDGLLMNLGVTYLQLKDYVRAAEYLRRAIDQSPRNPAAHYNMACLLVRLGQKDDAVASLAAARSNGMKMTASVKGDSDLFPLRGRADFETLFK